MPFKNKLRQKRLVNVELTLLENEIDKILCWTKTFSLIKFQFLGKLILKYFYLRILP